MVLFHAAVAQEAEHLNCNQCVGGSIPFCGSSTGVASRVFSWASFLNKPRPVKAAPPLCGPGAIPVGHLILVDAETRTQTCGRDPVYS